MFNYQELVNGKKPYIIAEIGSNHNGDIELAKKMILKAKECGADCVKFQSWSKDTIFSKKVYQDNFFLRDDYRNRTDYTLEEIVDKYSVDATEHHVLKAFCDEIQIDFSSTGFSKNEIDLLVDELNVPFIARHHKGFAVRFLIGLQILLLCPIHSSLDSRLSLLQHRILHSLTNRLYHVLLQ